MNFDFSALLVLLTAVSGAIWAVDAWFLRPRREAAAAPQADAGSPEEPLWVDYARSFFPVFLVVLILRSFIVEPFRIPSASMMPTLLIGDFILVNKYDYGIRLPVTDTKILENREPRRGDVVVFRYPEKPSVPFIKRVAGVPGDVISYRDKTLYINGIAMSQQDLGAYHSMGSGSYMGTVSLHSENLDGVVHDILLDPDRPSFDVDTVVPDNQYFVLGDNRDNSKDSRYWGFVPEQNLIGRAFFVWMNWDWKNGGINLRRIGTIYN